MSIWLFFKIGDENYGVMPDIDLRERDVRFFLGGKMWHTCKIVRYKRQQSQKGSVSETFS